jgi:hypothetical protein
MLIDVKKILTQVGVNVLDVFDLLYYPNMFTLMQELEKYKNYVFAPNDRIIFIHGEPEFIEHNLRFDLYNLQKIVFKIGIPNFACIVISQQDITKELENYQKMTTEIIPLGFIRAECHLIHMFNFDKEFQKVEFNLDLVEKQFIFLSNKPRSHRSLLFNWLSHNDLLTNGLISFNQKEEIKHLDFFNTVDYQNNNDLHLLHTLPFTRSNESWIAKDFSLRKILSKIPPDHFKNFEESSLLIRNNNSYLLQRTFCYISNETTFNYPGTFTSEKTFKSLPAMRPMISYGGKGCLAKLKDMGFKTWDKWWSEDYDNIDDPEERFVAVTNLIKYVSNLTISQCVDILQDMKLTLEYNQELYINHFVNNQINIIKDQAVKQLKGNHAIRTLE